MEIQQGKLYSFFLGIAKDFAYKKVHREKGVPEDGTEMYEHLKNNLENKYRKEYKALIQECTYLMPFQKNELLPVNGVIKTENLDFIMYMRIFRLLGGNTRTRLIKYMEKLRNRYCHISIKKLRDNMSQQEFRKQLDLMGQTFENYGIEPQLVDLCKRSILN